MHVLWFQDTKAAAKEEEAFATDKLEYTEHGAVSAGALAQPLWDFTAPAATCWRKSILLCGWRAQAF